MGDTNLLSTTVYSVTGRTLSMIVDACYRMGKISTSLDLNVSMPSFRPLKYIVDVLLGPRRTSSSIYFIDFRTSENNFKLPDNFSCLEKKLVTYCV